MRRRPLPCRLGTAWRFPAVFAAFCLALSLYPAAGFHFSSTERGTLSVFFMEEQVGYEEYAWEEDAGGFTLTVRGRMTKPVSLEIEEMVIRVDRNFIPERFVFKGKVSGMPQEVSSVLSEGSVISKIKVGGQEREARADVRRDAFLLPNPIFSPYLILTKKYRCGLAEKTGISAYIIPQTEVAGTVEPDEETPCRLLLNLGSTQVILETDEEGMLRSLDIPAQHLKVTPGATGTRGVSFSSPRRGNGSPFLLLPWRD